MKLNPIESSKIKYIPGFIAGALLGTAVVGLVFTGLLMIGLNRGVQAQALATMIGAVGTIALAIATFYNVVQNNRLINEQLLEKERPLAKDELSEIILPSIKAVEANLEILQNTEENELAFEWVYVDEPTMYSVAGEPQEIPSLDRIAESRLFSKDRELYASIAAVNGLVKEIGKEATEFHEIMRPAIKARIKEGATDSTESTTSLKAISQGVLEGIDGFGEAHEFNQFWEQHGEDLTNFAENEADMKIESINAGERVYQRELESLLEDLTRRRAELQSEFGISIDDVSSDRSRDIASTP